MGKDRLQSSLPLQPPLFAEEGDMDNPSGQKLLDQISRYQNSNSPKYTPWKEPRPKSLYKQWHKTRRKHGKNEICNEAANFIEAKKNPLPPEPYLPDEFPWEK